MEVLTYVSALFRARKNSKMSSRLILVMFIAFCFLMWIGSNPTSAQNSVSELSRLLSEKAAFSEEDFAQLQQGHTVVNLIPVQNVREIAVLGLVRLNVSAEEFVESFRETMVRKGDPAILEIGRFSKNPTLDDLRDLTIENRDIDDLKECVAGQCAVKLSSAMIKRFHKEVNWEAEDYRLQVTQLFKQILLEYVTDYLARGEAALIAYEDKQKSISLAKEQRSLMATAIYSPDALSKGSEHLKTSSKSALNQVESVLVWSKMDIGLKPVIAINHITIYKREETSGPQILVASKQLYANHYYDSSVALTAFVNVPGAGPYLYYENRSRVDGFGGFFGKMKRGIVETKAVDTLQAVLENSKLTLSARNSTQTDSEPVASVQNWRRWKIGSAHLIFLFLLITAFTALLVLSNYSPKRNLGR
ncbi:MAG TPA: hypothetical protein VJ023_18905 [Pyrinomonadaceae bacterium]|nr:hypothetical protein [Pyrinomonadaceae bacterium]